MKRIGEVQFVHCTCDPCSGQRDSAEIARDTEEYYGLLLIQKGSELIRHRNSDVIAHTGEVFFWDSTLPLQFALPDRLKKTTMFIPKTHLQRQLIHVDELVGTVLPARTGLGALVNANITTIGDQLQNLTGDSYTLAANLSLELITFG